MNRSLTNETVSAAPRVPQELLDGLQRSCAPVVIAHVVPDADALGSMLATALAIACEHCRPTVALPQGSLSQKLAFMVELAHAQVATLAHFADADAFIVLDTAKKDRCNVGPDLRQTNWSAGRPLLNIDHHETNTRFGSVNWVEPHASSACELVYHVLRAATLPISPTMASLLYAGIQTDTIGFSLPSTTPSALRAAADLVELGADVGNFGERIWRSQRKSEFDLLRVIYDNTRVVADGQVAYSSASFDEIHEAGCTAADIDDQINVPRSLDGVRLAMLFSEGREGKTRINFRSAGSVTVTDLAAEFGGGGHAQASGAILDCGLHEAIDKVLPRAVEHVRRFLPPADAESE
jgi:phosphoesterase RecJ-like protein